MIVVETKRLVLRRMTLEDAAFIFDLVNDPSWLQYIGDKRVRSLDDARQYILNGPMEMYARLGFGMYRVERRDDGIAIGTCGLIKRDFLENVDIGFAFLPAFRGKGYAFEAASAVLALGKNTLGLKRIVAIVSPDNQGSIRLLEKLGLTFERIMMIPGEETPVSLFSSET